MDREKVMEALDCLAHGGGIYDCLKFPCPYGFYGYTDCHKWEIARDALELLKEQPEIVRCKDCKFFISEGHCCKIRGMGRVLKPDDFCSDGMAVK